MLRLLLLATVALSLAAAEKPAPVAAWDFAAFTGGEVKPSAGGLALAGTGAPEKVDGKGGVRFTGGQYVSGVLETGPLASGAPLALEIDVAPAAKPTAYLAGLVQAGTYQESGVRILLRQDLCVVVEHFIDLGADKAVYLVAGSPLPLGRLSTVRYEHDGKKARLLVDGKVQETRACAPAARWNGPFQVGSASGNGYDLDGVVTGVRLFALAPVGK